MTTLNRIGRTGGGLLALALFAGTSPALAQEGSARWLAFTGCWQPLEERTEEQPSLVCVVPTGDGVELRSIADGEVTATQTVIADGRARTIRDEGCETVESYSFPADGHWVTSTSRYTCEGGTQGSANGLLAMVSPFEWIHVQVVRDGDEPMTAVMRYELVDSETAAEAGYASLTGDRERAVRMARISASQPLDVNDLIAASGTVDPAALTAWIVESGNGFELDGDALVRLADAGIEEEVIDMVVATSYPERFAVATGPRGDRSAEALPNQGDRYDRRGRRAYTAMFGFGWGPFGYWSPLSYYRGLYGYGYGGYAGYGGYGYWGYRPTVIVVQPQGPTSHGRVIRGRGYSRGSSGSSGGGGDFRRSGGSGTGTAAPPSSGSGTRTDTQRKAKPRGGR